MLRTESWLMCRAGAAPGPPCFGVLLLLPFFASISGEEPEKTDSLSV